MNYDNRLYKKLVEEINAISTSESSGQLVTTAELNEFKRFALDMIKIMKGDRTYEEVFPSREELAKQRLSKIEVLIKDAVKRSKDKRKVYKTDPNWNHKTQSYKKQ